MVSNKKLILKNRLSPGDILIMSCTVRDLKLAYPDYQIDVRSPCNEIFWYNPHITSLSESDPEVLSIDMNYPLIDRALQTGAHFSDGHRLYLQDLLKKRIPKTSMRPEIYLTKDEINWISQLKVEHGFEGKYWLINAGIKNDYTLKQYPFYQEVVDLLKGKIQFVQIGLKTHNHVPLNGVIDMVGKTENIRSLFRLSYFAEGALCAVSLQMVIMQSFKKPCVIVCGGREGMRWQAINDHIFLHTNGLLPCCLEDGCWRSKWDDCDNKINNVPKCMTLITPQRVADSILSYYEGGRLNLDNDTILSEY